MRLQGRRTSSNVRDRRGISGKAVGVGGGLLGVIVVALVTLLGGGSLGDVVQNVVGSQSGFVNPQGSEYVETPEQARLAEVASKILAGTEDVWTREFRRQGWGEYKAPEMVLYTGSVQSGCGHATSQVGPFYCSADQTIYIDLDFFQDMERTIGESGDFAYAYVIAHEVGHHVQYLLGILDDGHAKMARLPEAEANQISVRMELQADCLAGVWANLDNEMFQSIEEGDVERAIKTASLIGDDYLQRKAYGKEMPESFNHGRSSQRVKWLSKGLQSGDPNVADTFSPPYQSL